MNDGVADVPPIAWVDAVPRTSIDSSPAVISPSSGDRMTAFVIKVHMAALVESVHNKVMFAGGEVGSGKIPIDASGNGSARFVPGIEATPGRYTIEVVNANDGVPLGSVSILVTG